MSAPVCSDSTPAEDDKDSSSSPAGSGSPTAFFCQTIYIPIINHEITLTEIELTSEAYTSTGKSSSIGTGKCTVSFLEHGVTKIISFLKKDSTSIGDISLSFFYYKFPMDIRDFGNRTHGYVPDEEGGAQSDRGALERQKRFVREYNFLRSRSGHWGGDRLSTWNYTTQKLLDNDESIALQRSRNIQHTHQTRESRSPSRSKSSRRLVHRSQTPKSRRTVMSVGYIGSGVDWPTLSSSSVGGKGALSHIDKLQCKLHLAHERRLNLLEKTAELIRARNSQIKTKQDLLSQLKNRQSLSESQLKEMLRERERSLQELERKYLELKHENNTFRKHHSNQQRINEKKNNREKTILGYLNQEYEHNDLKKKKKKKREKDRQKESQPKSQKEKTPLISEGQSPKGRSESPFPQPRVTSLQKRSTSVGANQQYPLPNNRISWSDSTDSLRDIFTPGLETFQDETIWDLLNEPESVNYGAKKADRSTSIEFKKSPSSKSNTQSSPNSRPLPLSHFEMIERHNKEMERLRRILETEEVKEAQSISEVHDDIDNLLADYQNDPLTSTSYRSKSIQKEMDMIDSVIDNLESHIDSLLSSPAINRPPSRVTAVSTSSREPTGWSSLLLDSDTDESPVGWENEKEVHSDEDEIWPEWSTQSR